LATVHPRLGKTVVTSIALHFSESAKRYPSYVGFGCIMQFSRIIGPMEDFQIWSAKSRGFSFVISNESRSGPGLHGQPGFVASWRPIDMNRPAIRVGGSPFKTFAEAEKACEAMLKHLIDERAG
jgi:hypothetical protein